VLGQADAELLEQEFLLCRGFGEAAQTDLMTIGGWGEQCRRFAG